MGRLQRVEKEEGPLSVYRQMLLKKRAAAVAGMGMNAQSLVAADRIPEDDQAQYSHGEAVALKLNGFEYMQLRQIQEALDRLESGGYGICLCCEERIPTKRLHALPWAKYCVACQEKLAGDSWDGAESVD
jgi:DnaK suppressor protein